MMKIFTKTFIPALCLALSAGYAKGEEIGVDLRNDLGTVSVGQTYSLSKKGDYYYYTPEESGLITVQTNFDGNYNLIGYQDQCYFFLYDLSWAAGPGVYAFVTSPSMAEIVDGGYRFLFNVKAGEKYIFGYGDNLRTPLDFEILDIDAEEIPAVLTYCYPTPGTTFDTGMGINDVTLEFDQNLVSVEGVTMDYTNKEGKSVSVPLNNNYTGGPEYSTNQLIARFGYANGIFKAAKEDADYDYPFYLSFNKVQCTGGPVTSTNIREGKDFVECNSDGDIRIEYQFMDAVKLIKYNMPSTLYSYFAPGTPEGMATFEFDGPVIASGARLIMIMGNHPMGTEGGDELDPSWDINYSLNEDNTVLTLNFTGIDYGKYLEKNYSMATVIITGIKGENGLLADLDNGIGAIEFFPKYVNSPFEGVEIPGNITETPTITPRNYSLLRELVDLELTWSQPVELVAGLIPEAEVVLDINAPVQVPLYVNNGSLFVALSEIKLPGNSFSGQCEITIPGGIIKNSEGLVNAPLMLAYTLSVSDSSGVDTIGSEKEECIEIYTIRGEKVSPSDSLRGIYIINGKKVLLK
ncbi:MAG: hypothetical protein J1F67_06220 [Muribaculaceae bacterium]|nr:hypothetical protein [Muribaculaceae bacterium]